MFSSYKITYNSISNIYASPIFNRILFIALIAIIILNSKNKNSYVNSPEVNIYNEQKLKVINPSKKCPSSSKTLYFTTNLIHSKEIRNDIKIITLEDKNQFVTFYISDFGYNFYANILKENGLIRSYIPNGIHNLYIGSFIKDIYRLSKANRFHGKDVFLKDSLYINYKYMKDLYNDDFNYMPQTYYYPKDKIIIENKFKSYEFNKSDLWLIKPVDKSSGKGIFFFHSFNDIKLKEYIITQYISNLNLINNKKYDFRLYVLISGIQPLRIYFHKNGFARIATEYFTLDSDDKYVHLTNRAINKKNKKYIFPANSTDANSNILNIKTYSNYIKEKYKTNWLTIRQKIKDVIIKSIISVYKTLIAQEKNYNSNVMSHYCLLGFDILLTDEFNPILLEINNGPDVVISDIVDKEIKIKVFLDIMNIIGISPFNKKIRDTNKFNRNEIINNAICEITRPRGDFELIFPLKENIEKYRKFFKDNNDNENDFIFWEKLKKSSISA